MNQIQKNPYARSPTLQTVMMIERFIEKIPPNIITLNYGENFQKKLCGKRI